MAAVISSSGTRTRSQGYSSIVYLLCLSKSCCHYANKVLFVPSCRTYARDSSETYAMLLVHTPQDSIIIIDYAVPD